MSISPDNSNSPDSPKAPGEKTTPRYDALNEKEKSILEAQLARVYPNVKDEAQKDALRESMAGPSSVDGKTPVYKYFHDEEKMNRLTKVGVEDDDERSVGERLDALEKMHGLKPLTESELEDLQKNGVDVTTHRIERLNKELFGEEKASPNSKEPNSKEPNSKEPNSKEPNNKGASNIPEGLSPEAMASVEEIRARTGTSDALKQNTVDINIDSLSGPSGGRAI